MMYGTHVTCAAHDDACWMCRYQEDAAGEGSNEVPNVATFRKPFVAIQQVCIVTCMHHVKDSIAASIACLLCPPVLPVYHII
jgi:hypothetical protein